MSLSTEHTDWLFNNQYLYDALLAGAPKEVCTADAKKLQEIAKTIDPDRHFTIYGCQDCMNALIKFCFENGG